MLRSDISLFTQQLSHPAHTAPQHWVPLGLQPAHITLLHKGTVLHNSGLLVPTRKMELSLCDIDHSSIYSFCTVCVSTETLTFNFCCIWQYQCAVCVSMDVRTICLSAIDYIASYHILTNPCMPCWSKYNRPASPRRCLHPTSWHAHAAVRYTRIDSLSLVWRSREAQQRWALLLVVLINRLLETHEGDTLTKKSIPSG